MQRSLLHRERRRRKRATMDQKSPVYIGIPDHIEIRKLLLLGSKDLLSSLKAYESIKEIKTQRAEATFELHRVMDEISVLVKKTRMNLPKPPQRIGIDGQVKEDAEADQDKPGKKPKKANEDKLSAIDSELNKIESRLKKLKSV